MRYPKELAYRGAAALIADACGVKPGAVYSWKSKGRIPDRYRIAIKLLLAAPAPEPVDDEPLTGGSVGATPTRVRLSDVVDLIADFLRERNL